ncbi:dolichol-P-glucose synthetase [Neptunitalea chrysea]|uniref:Dolichol-P-glucose synthetase n=1 Tax=Neptunitalea chrysea TaxID=1647581 RepID=A0A9W6B547_9FLAO|nr:glycosyltransferase family 2 protein [Neptunitalea chrysea]GLB52966.1 dolichol-P-glucose synthetase [Neptunitalea chrysea]
MEQITLSIVMPCLNEAETLATCIEKAQRFCAEQQIAAEVIIADNGSTDGSVAIAKKLGARVVHVTEKGYGSALRGGIDAAKGTFIIMADADDSYDFYNLNPFIEKLEEGYELVMGNRFKGGIEKGAMPFLHRYLGNPVLSFVGRLFFKSSIGDFHCGLRGFTKALYNKLNLHTTGMEFASEMIVKANLQGVKIVEVSVVLSPDGRSGKPHLNTWRDGWRHLRFLLLYCPMWLFLIPGLILMIPGLLATAALVTGPVTLGSITFDVHTLIFASSFILIGFQFVVFYGLTKVYTIENELLPKTNTYNRLFKYINLEKGLLLGFLLSLAGLVLGVLAYNYWKELGFGDIESGNPMRLVIVSVTTMLLGVQIILFSLFFSILGLKKK